MRIIDAHLHWFSRPFFETLADLSPQGGDVSAKLSAVSERTGIELPSTDGDEHLARWTSEFDAAGVERAFAFGRAHVAGPGGEVAVEECLEITLADKANAGAVLLGVVIEPRFFR